jgi:hypothetical protein
VLVDLNSSLMLLSTKSKGRQLLDATYAYQVPGNRLLLTKQASSSQFLMPFQFGADSLEVSGYGWWDWARERFYSLPGTGLDVLSLKPSPHHDALAFDAAPYTFAHGNDWAWWGESSQSAIVFRGLTDLTEPGERIVVPTPQGMSPYVSLSENERGALIRFDGPVTIMVDLVTHAFNTFPVQFGSLSPLGAFAEFRRPTLYHQLSTVTLARMGSATEIPVADDVESLAWGADGALWVSRDVDLATRSSILSRIDPQTQAIIDLPRAPRRTLLQPTPSSGAVLAFSTGGVDLVSADGSLRHLTDEHWRRNTLAFSPDEAWVAIDLQGASTNTHLSVLGLTRQATIPIALGDDTLWWVNSRSLMLIYFDPQGSPETYVRIP